MKNTFKRREKILGNKNISDSTYKELINLLRASFDANEKADDCAYDLDYRFLTNASDIYHHSVAHKYPELADEISELLIKENARPYREKELPYSSVIEIFESNLKIAKDYQSQIIQAINTAEYNEDYEVKIALEEFLLKFLPYIKQAEMWVEKAKAYQGQEVQFDIHFQDVSPYIPLEK